MSCSVTHLIPLEQGLSELEVHVSVKHPGSAWLYSLMLGSQASMPCLAFMRVPGSQTQVLVLAKQVFLPTESSHQPKVIDFILASLFTNFYLIPGPPLFLLHFSCPFLLVPSFLPVVPTRISLPSLFPSLPLSPSPLYPLKSPSLSLIHIHLTDFEKTIISLGVRKTWWGWGM